MKGKCGHLNIAKFQGVIGICTDCHQVTLENHDKHIPTIEEIKKLADEKDVEYWESKSGEYMFTLAFAYPHEQTDEPHPRPHFIGYKDSEIDRRRAWRLLTLEENANE